MSSLTLLIWIAVYFAAFALLLWAGILIYRLHDERRIAARQAVRDRWLGKLLEVTENPSDLSGLPAVGGAQEMDDVLELLRDLAERFRGQYRDYLGKVLTQIGAQRYALELLKHRRADARVRGCAILAWVDSHPKINRPLRQALSDPDSHVRLEACHTLAMHRAISAREMLDSLRDTPAIDSMRTRDMARQLAPGHSADFGELLKKTHSPREMELLLEGIGESGDFSLANDVASFLRNEHPLVRIAAICALEKLGDPAHKPLVAELRSDSERRVRLAVAKYFKSMAQQSDEDATLEHLAGDEDFDVQRVAVYSLVELAGHRLEKFREKTNTPLVDALLTEALSASHSPSDDSPQ